MDHVTMHQSVSLAKMARVLETVMYQMVEHHIVQTVTLHSLQYSKISRVKKKFLQFQILNKEMIFLT